MYLSGLPAARQNNLIFPSFLQQNFRMRTARTTKTLDERGQIRGLYNYVRVETRFHAE
jgi:hypothetical protein